MNRRIDGRTNRQTDGRTARRLSGRTDMQTDQRTDKHRRTEPDMYTRIDRGRDTNRGKRTDEKTDRQTVWIDDDGMFWKMFLPFRSIPVARTVPRRPSPMSCDLIASIIAQSSPATANVRRASAVAFQLSLTLPVYILTLCDGHSCLVAVHTQSSVMYLHLRLHDHCLRSYGLVSTSRGLHA